MNDTETSALQTVLQVTSGVQLEEAHRVRQRRTEAPSKWNYSKSTILASTSTLEILVFVFYFL